MQKITLHEHGARGFFSNIATILSCARFLTSQGVDINSIFIGKYMFTCYGHPINWFSPSCVSDHGEIVDSLTGWNLDRHCSSTQLDLLQYLSRFPWNDRITQYLQNHVKIPKNTLGMHFRGTDHNHPNDPGHGARVELDVYLAKMRQLWQTGEFNAVFLCSDETSVMNNATNFLIHECNVDNIIINPVTRISGSVGLHMQHIYFNKSKLADEVILDATCLSKCHTVIGKSSNLINFARILTPSIKVDYIDL